MMDSFRSPQVLLLIGGTSEIGLKTVQEIAKRNRLKKIIVTSRNEKSLDISKKILQKYDIEFEGHELDLENTNNLKSIIDTIFENNSVDICLISAGYLPENEITLIDSKEAVKTALINYVGPLEVGVSVMSRFKSQGFGYLVIISSAAASRPRKDIFTYGSAKSAIDHWAEGYSYTLNSPAVKIIIVRPGMVRTKMSSGLKEIPFTVNTIDVANQILLNITKKNSIIWVPSKLKYVIFLIKHLPRFIYIRIKIR
jgi:decaprenylphospho-beta-D-erythro-pentofuranosid-2-ulose 2-reductase